MLPVMVRYAESYEEEVHNFRDRIIFRTEKSKAQSVKKRSKSLKDIVEERKNWLIIKKMRYSMNIDQSGSSSLPSPPGFG